VRDGRSDAAAGKVSRGEILLCTAICGDFEDGWKRVVKERKRARNRFRRLLRRIERERSQSWKQQRATVDGLVRKDDVALIGAPGPVRIRRGRATGVSLPLLVHQPGGCAASGQLGGS
jgi:hypothetical protein